MIDEGAKRTLLIGDVGATGSDWAFTRDGKTEFFSLIGYNPVSQSQERLQLLLEKLAEYVGDSKVEIHYYGAGIGLAAHDEIISRGFRQALKVNEISLYSDLLGAARALCGLKPGVICILGTGSNACYYDGSVLERGRSLGYPLGDEGSGMDMGKRLVKAYYYQLMPGHIKAFWGKILPENRLTFLSEFKNNAAPNQYLASLTRYMSEIHNEPFIKQIVKDSFTDFIRYHLHLYERKSEINAVGSIAYYFCGELESCLKESDLRLGRVLPKPIEALGAFHLQYQTTKDE